MATRGSHETRPEGRGDYRRRACNCKTTEGTATNYTIGEYNGHWFLLLWSGRTCLEAQRLVAKTLPEAQLKAGLTVKGNSFLGYDEDESDDTGL